MSRSDLGPVPDGWQVAQLGDLLELCRNGANVQQEPTGPGLPVTRIETIARAAIDYERVGYVNVSEADLSSYRLEAGDILFSHINSVAHIGKVALYDGARPLYHGMNLLLLRPRKDKADPAFLAAALASRAAKRFFEARAKKAINQASLNRKDISALRLPVPTLPEQRRIAVALRSISDAISEGEAVLTEVDAVRRVLTQDLIRAGLPGRGRAAWETRTVGDVARIGGGFAFPLRLQGRTDLDIPFYKVSDMNAPGNERVLGKAAHYVSQPTLAEMGAKTFPAGTTVFPKVGAALLTNKRRMLGVEASFDNNVMGLVPLKVQPAFLYYFMKTVDFRALVQPGALPSVNGATVAAIPIPVPPPNDQVAVVDALAAVDENIEAQRDTVAERTCLKMAVADALLTGVMRTPARGVT